MEFKEIASVSGKGGLYTIVKPTKSGVILESMDEKKSKLVAGINHRISVLDEISIYTTDQEGTMPLQEVMIKMHSEFDGDTGVDSKSSNEELRAFFSHVLPNHDEERVYPSDIKKMVSWYNTLVVKAPELLKASEEKE